MAPQTINVLLTTFPGLNLPKTLTLPIPSTSTHSDLTTLVSSRLPPTATSVFLTTTSNKLIHDDATLPITSLLNTPTDTLLPLRLSHPLCGGKGGFGSQLRAAGGRMSSRRKRNAGENNSSNRNLDGRRLRTINEAKALAEYLALKPEMEAKEKEKRRKRWEEVVAAAERREEEIKNNTKGKVDGKWVEEREEAGERTREAVLEAMRAGGYTDLVFAAGDDAGEGSSGGASGEGSEMDEDDEEDVVESSAESPAKELQGQASTPARRYVGFDEDDEFMSDEEEEEEAAIEPEVVGKGKGRA